MNHVITRSTSALVSVVPRLATSWSLGSGRRHRVVEHRRGLRGSHTSNPPHYVDQVLALDALLKAGTPLRQAPIHLFALDDIDRIPSGKIRELFDFVDRTEHLPQLIYVMTFDRHRIEPIVVGSDAPKRRRRLQQVAFDLTCTHRQRPNGALG